MVRTFKSKTDKWFFITVLLFSGLLIYCVWFRHILWAIPLAACDIWLIAALLRTEYVFTENNILLIKSGYAPTIQIPVDQIISVSPIKSYRPAYAGSFSRIKIIWKSGHIHRTRVSPADPVGFIAYMRRLNPTITVINI